MTQPGPNHAPAAATVHPTAPPATPNQPIDRDRQGVAPMYGGLYPRWPLLAAILMTPFIVAGYLIHFYYASHSCPFGAACQLDHLNGVAQVGLIWLVFGLFWLLTFIFGVRPLEGPQIRDATGYVIDDEHPTAHFLRALSDFGPTRWLLVMLGGLALVGALASVLLGRITATALAFAGIVVVIGACTLFWRPEPARSAARRPETAQEAMQREARAATAPLNVFRDLRFVNRIFPRRARQRNVAPPGP